MAAAVVGLAPQGLAVGVAAAGLDPLCAPGAVAGEPLSGGPVASPETQTESESGWPAAGDREAFTTARQAKEGIQVTVGCEVSDTEAQSENESHSQGFPL
jgi:hypothetical protein